MDGAAQDVQAAINAAAGTLPSTLPYPPVYAKVNPADAPILTLALTSDRCRSTWSRTRRTRCCSPSSARSRASARSRCRAGCAGDAGADRPGAAGGLRSVDGGRPDRGGAANVNGAKGGFDGRAQAFALAANDQLLTPEAYRTW